MLNIENLTKLELWNLPQEVKDTHIELFTCCECGNMLEFTDVEFGTDHGTCEGCLDSYDNYDSFEKECAE
jgi:hypothetical protein